MYQSTDKNFYAVLNLNFSFSMMHSNAIITLFHIFHEYVFRAVVINPVPAVSRKSSY